jgi:hypothetical protein
MWSQWSARAKPRGSAGLSGPAADLAVNRADVHRAPGGVAAITLRRPLVMALCIAWTIAALTTLVTFLRRSQLG